MLDLTVPEIKQKLMLANEEEFAVLERSLVADTRKGVRQAIEVARRRLQAQKKERERLAAMYAFEQHIAEENGASVILGLDEVGRGPLAGPLAVGAVVLPRTPYIEGLNDSKQIASNHRDEIAHAIHDQALAWAVCYVEPSFIDRNGMTASLKHAFSEAIQTIEKTGIVPDIILLDGNPLRIDSREKNVIKGDAKCASIAAASIVAKVARDHLMDEYDSIYPAYGFASNKGYASAEHRAALESVGLSPIHRRSFCSSFLQPTLF